jgi:hypothetical protein
LNQTRWDLNSDYSDRLLGENFQPIFQEMTFKIPIKTSAVVV